MAPLHAGEDQHEDQRSTPRPQEGRRAVQGRRPEVCGDGLLGLRLPADGDRHPRALQDHAAGRRRSRRGRGGGRWRIIHGDLDGGVDGSADRVRALSREGVQGRARPRRARAVLRLHRLRSRSVRARARSPTSPPRSSATSSASSRSRPCGSRTCDFPSPTSRPSPGRRPGSWSSASGSTSSAGRCSAQP